MMVEERKGNNESIRSIGIVDVDGGDGCWWRGRGGGRWERADLAVSAVQENSHLLRPPRQLLLDCMSCCM